MRRVVYFSLDVSGASYYLPETNGEHAMNRYTRTTAANPWVTSRRRARFWRGVRDFSIGACCFAAMVAFVMFIVQNMEDM